MVSLNDLPLRDDLRGLSPYGAPQKAVRVALNVNENTHPIPEEVARDITASLTETVSHLNRYPDREFTHLRESLAHYLGAGLAPEQLWAANGSNEVLQQVFQAFGGPGRRALGFDPTYSMYQILARGTGTAWVAGTRDDGYLLSADTAVRQVQEHAPDIVLLCSPNNPTGTPLALETIEAVYDATKSMVIVDEAYGEFAGPDAVSAATLLPGRERLLVSRSMSKAFAFAGVRLGYLAADPAVIDALRLVRLPYHLSTLTQVAALAALRHSDSLLETVADIILQRDRIVEVLGELGFSAIPSATNFVLFGGVKNPAELFQQLLERGILIRDPGIPGHLRVTAGTEQETTAFLAALTEITAG
ncbi:MAG: histidinol-phosphate transaminase [Terrimesophilobacter sp.]